VRHGARSARRAGGRVATLKPALLAALLRAPGAVAQRLVGLRCALPACDVKELVLRDPALLLRVRAAQAGAHARQDLEAARARGCGGRGAWLSAGTSLSCCGLPGARGHLHGDGVAEARAFWSEVCAMSEARRPLRGAARRGTLSSAQTQVCRTLCNVLRPGCAPRQEVEDVVAEVSAVAAILGLDDRIMQELISLQPRRARGAGRDAHPRPQGCCQTGRGACSAPDREWTCMHANPCRDMRQRLWQQSLAGCHTVSI